MQCLASRPRTSVLPAQADASPPAVLRECGSVHRFFSTEKPEHPWLFIELDARECILTPTNYRIDAHSRRRSPGVEARMDVAGVRYQRRRKHVCIFQVTRCRLSPSAINRKSKVVELGSCINSHSVPFALLGVKSHAAEGRGRMAVITCCVKVRL